MIHEIANLIQTTVMITGFVMVMMLFIEYLNVKTRGGWSKRLLKSRFSQIATASVLGLIPGCLGGFAAVSLFTHKMLSFGALTAAMIASSGDEAFVMFALFPEKALLIQLILFTLALGSGWLIDRLTGDYRPHLKTYHPFEIHTLDKTSESYPPENWKESLVYNLRHLSFSRFLLITGILFFIFSLVFGHGGHEEAGPHPFSLFGEYGFNLVFALLSLGALFIILVSDQHFLDEHLWHHIIKKHFLRIVFWTFAALLLIRGIEAFVDASVWIGENRLTVLFAAVLIGLIPESGPHLIFVTLFAEGSLPFSILLASSIVQDGHSALPLLAESKKGFFLVKTINMGIGLGMGLLGYFSGF